MCRNMINVCILTLYPAAFVISFTNFANTYIWNLKIKKKNGADEPSGRAGIKT